MKSIMTDTAEFMSEIAYIYDIICHPCTEKRISMYKDVFSTAFPNGIVHILDMGCCTGETAVQISDERFFLTGIDISSGMIEEASKKNVTLNKNVAFEIMNMKELMFEDESFDIIYSNSLEWIDSKDDLERVIQESARCLKQGGVLLLDFPFHEKFLKTCRPFYAECVELEDGAVYKLTRYEKSDVRIILQAMQTYIHVSELVQYVYTGQVKWRLHTSDEVIEITKRYDLYHSQTFYDYDIGIEGAFIQLLFFKGGD